MLRDHHLTIFRERNPHQRVATRPKTWAVLCAVLACVVATAAADARDHRPRGLISRTPGAALGYTLYSPMELEKTFLMDLDGKVVHSWTHDTQPAASQYLLPDGSLLRTGNLKLHNVFGPGRGAGGRVEQLAWDGTLQWRFDFANDEHLQHHDIEPLPNGNVLILAWERKNAEEALAAGRSPKLMPDAEVWPEMVIEYDPKAAATVWEWHLWDHLVQDHDPTKANYGDVAVHPERVDLNYTLDGNGDEDWIHANAVDYNPLLDQIMISSRSFSELWIIDHSTTTDEARGRAGDLLFRFGNPAAYRHPDSPRKLYVQHDTEWIPAGLPGAGDILVFSNGLPHVREYSTIEEITPKMDGSRYVENSSGEFAADVHRVYPKQKSQRFFSAIISGAQRLANGDTLITDGPHGRFLEVTPHGAIVWEYENRRYRIRKDTPKESGAGVAIDPWWVFRAHRYAPSDPAVSALRR